MHILWLLSGKVSAKPGYVEGQNVAIEYRWADNEVHRLPEMAAELVRRKVTVSPQRRREFIALLGGVAGSQLAARSYGEPMLFQIMKSKGDALV
jgi:putative ABC transport system substrate-binding protein